MAISVFLPLITPSSSVTRADIADISSFCFCDYRFMIKSSKADIADISSFCSCAHRMATWPFTIPTSLSLIHTLLFLDPKLTTWPSTLLSSLSPSRAFKSAISCRSEYTCSPSSCFTLPSTACGKGLGKVHMLGHELEGL